MSPTLAAAIDTADDLAWRPTSNLAASLAYGERREAADRLVALLATARLPTGASDELRFVRTYGVSYGFNFSIRAWTVYRKDEATLGLEDPVGLAEDDVFGGAE